MVLTRLLCCVVRFFLLSAELLSFVASRSPGSFSRHLFLTVLQPVAVPRHLDADYSAAPKRSTAKPNTRFLSSVIQSVDGHNKALLERERQEKRIRARDRQNQPQRDSNQEQQRQQRHRSERPSSPSASTMRRQQQIYDEESDPNGFGRDARRDEAPSSSSREGYQHRQSGREAGFNAISRFGSSDKDRRYLLDDGHAPRQLSDGEEMSSNGARKRYRDSAERSRAVGRSDDLRDRDDGDERRSNRRDEHQDEEDEDENDRRRRRWRQGRHPEESDRCGAEDERDDERRRHHRSSRSPEIRQRSEQRRHEHVRRERERRRLESQTTDDEDEGKRYDRQRHEHHRQKASRRDRPRSGQSSASIGTKNMPVLDTPGNAAAPTISIPSKMDAVFSPDYDPRTDLSGLLPVPSEGLVQDVGWDSMLEVMKERRRVKKRKKDSRRHPREASDDDDDEDDVRRRRRRRQERRERRESRANVDDDDDEDHRPSSTMVEARAAAARRNATTREWDVGKVSPF